MVDVSSSLQMIWQDVAAWVTVLLAAWYVFWYFRRGEKGRLVNCSGCSHCPLVGEPQP